MYRQTLAYIIGRITGLIEHPMFNFGSILIVLASTVSLSLPAILNLSLVNESLLLKVDIILLQIIATEMLLRVASIKRRMYMRSFAFTIDLLTILPLFFNGLLRLSSQFEIQPDSFQLIGTPGYLLFQGIRCLRLLPALYFFHRRRQTTLSGPERISPIKLRIFSGIAGLTFSIILVIGLTIAAWLHINTNEKKELRKQQISLQARSYGVLQTRLVFDKLIIGSWITEQGNRIWIPGNTQNPAQINKYYKTDRDYVQIDEILPGQSIVITFLDLIHQQRRVELTILFVGITIIFTLIGSLNIYLNKLILDPVEKARRTIQLRMYEEEIESSEIAREPYTEIVRLINDIDHLYKRMRAPAKKLISQNSGD